jgi:beta-phosphoglucomutase-like phosphatase (HAD superfamily)
MYIFNDITDTDIFYYRPDPYLLGAERCGVEPSRCLVVEDAPAGIISGHTAGCKTLALITSHTREQVEGAKPDYIVKNLSRYALLPRKN